MEWAGVEGHRGPRSRAAADAKAWAYPLSSYLGRVPRDTALGPLHTSQSSQARQVGKRGQLPLCLGTRPANCCVELIRALQYTTQAGWRTGQAEGLLWLFHSSERQTASSCPTSPPEVLGQVGTSRPCTFLPLRVMSCGTEPEAREWAGAVGQGVQHTQTSPTLTSFCTGFLNGLSKSQTGRLPSSALCSGLIAAGLQLR